ncbi:MAG: PIN domain-containing protein [Methanobacteriota archaeon]|nr:MAG: PIN domain-containing protein [Euryarchaeota archaeon]
MSLIYLDTNIYLDYWSGRSDKLRPLGEFAYAVHRRSVECEFTILASDLVLTELRRSIDDGEIKEVFSSLKECHKLLIEKVGDSDVKTAKALKNEHPEVPLPDLIHYCFAINNKADVLVTRDAHFTMLPQERIKIRKPEEI